MLLPICVSYGMLWGDLYHIPYGSRFLFRLHRNRIRQETHYLGVPRCSYSHTWTHTQCF